eukprot:COSAG01_NODE_30_length_36127_cov_41.433234_36_plen_228_part_00
MHSMDDFNCSRGYEWFLVDEARKRNPKIKVWGLVWGTPAWVSANSSSTSAAGLFEPGSHYAEYLIRWLDCSEQLRGQRVDYIGILNEEEQGTGNATNRLSWLKDFRRALDVAGYTHVGIIPETGIGHFANWTIVDAMLDDPDLKASIAAVGSHYSHVEPTVKERASMIPMVGSETCSCMPSFEMAMMMAASINRDYILGSVTGYVNWALVVGWYDFVSIALSLLMLF